MFWLQYGFTFDEIVNDDDTKMEKNGVTLLIDAMSLQYLVGAEIDWMIWKARSSSFATRMPRLPAVAVRASRFDIDSSCHRLSRVAVHQRAG